MEKCAGTGRKAQQLCDFQERASGPRLHTRRLQHLVMMMQMRKERLIQLHKSQLCHESRPDDRTRRQNPAVALPTPAMTKTGSGTNLNPSDLNRQVCEVSRVGRKSTITGARLDRTKPPNRWIRKMLTLSTRHQVYFCIHLPT